MAPNLPTENYSLMRTLKGGKGRFSKGPRHSPASHPWKRKTPRQIDRWLQHYQRVSPLKARCLKITEKVSIKIASEASYVYNWHGQKLIKSAQNGPFWRVLKFFFMTVYLKKISSK